MDWIWIVEKCVENFNKMKQNHGKYGKKVSFSHETAEKVKFLLETAVTQTKNTQKNSYKIVTK